MMNCVVVGDRSFGGKELRGGSVVLESPISGDDLKFDSLNADVLCEDTKHFPLADEGGMILLDSSGAAIVARPRLDDPTKYEYGTPISFLKGGELKGSFYFETAEDKGNCIYRITGISDIELIDNGGDHYGGMYNGDTFEDVLSDVIGTAIPYTVEERIKAIKIYGYLPVAARRENLRQLLFATGAVLKRAQNGVLHVSSLDRDAYRRIDRSRFYKALSIPKKTEYASVVVVEHSYSSLASDEEKTLYDGQSASEQVASPKGAVFFGTLVKFDGGPFHSQRIEGATILEAGVNYAVISPAPQCVLKGKVYTHGTKEVKRTTPNIPQDKVNKVKTSRVENTTLISFVNSESVAERYLGYSAMASSATANIVVGAEHPGSSVSMESSYQKLYSGFLQTLDFSINGLSSTFKASALFVLGYEPPDPGNTYQHVQVLTTNGIWTVPNGVKKIRVVLISGGTGGFSGHKGEDGGQGASYSDSIDTGAATMSISAYVYGKAGAGGKSGNGGSGGKVHDITLDVSEGQSINASIGTGGAGGSFVSGVDSAVGSDGSDSLFGAYSSAHGAKRTNGYLDIISGTRYGFSGDLGVSGAMGTGNIGEGENFVIVEGPPIVVGLSTYTPGKQGQQMNASDGFGYSTRQEGDARGGLGGGAAFGSNGQDGADGYVDIYARTSGEKCEILGRVNGGNGGGGAVPAKNERLPIARGCGGSGGHGGGGGGGGGLGVLRTTRWKKSTLTVDTKTKLEPTMGGIGGDGGIGGTGSDGCILIYW